MKSDPKIDDPNQPSKIMLLWDAICAQVELTREAVESNALNNNLFAGMRARRSLKLIKKQIHILWKEIMTRDHEVIKVRKKTRKPLQGNSSS